MPLPPSKRIRFGTYEADLGEGTLTKGGFRIRLQEQPFQILALLLERPGQVVTRQEIQQKLWAGNTFVEFDAGLNTAMRKLRTALSDSADNPTFIETVQRRGYRFLAPVALLEAPAESGPATASAPVRAETRSPIPLGERTASPNHRRYWVAVACTLLLVGGAVYWFRPVRLDSASAGARAAAVAPRRSVALLGFRDLPLRADEDGMASAFSEMLGTELAAGGTLRMVPGEDVARAKRDLHVAGAETLSKETLERLRVTPGADVVVLGSYTRIEDKGQKRIRVDIRLQDTLTGETLASEAFTGAEENLFEVATQAGARLRERLGAAPVTAEAANAARASLPSNKEATRLYAEGRAKLWNFEPVAARDLLVKAEALDPGSAAIHSALADAWSTLGYQTTAQEEAKQAFDLSSTLSREEQLYSEGRYHELMRDWPKASDAYRALTRFFPDNLEYGLRLAAALSSDGKAQDSLQALDALRRLPKPTSNDPRIDLQEAATYDHAGDYQRLKTASANAASKAQKRGSPILLAEAKLLQSQAASRTDDAKAAMVLVEESQEIFEHAGDKYGVARAGYRMGDLLFRQGHFAESNAVLEQCLHVFQTLGNDGHVAATLNDIAGGLEEMGELSQAKSMYEQALVKQRLVRNKRGIADTLNNLGTLLVRQGNLSEATRYYEAALPFYQELGEKAAVGYLQLNMGNVLLAQGDLSGARNLLDESLAIQRTLGNSSDVAEVLHNLAEALAEQGDVVGAQNAYDEALAIRVKQGEQSSAAQTRLGKANLFLETGSPRESEPLARSALEELTKDKQSEDEQSARNTLALVLIELGRPAEARTELAEAMELNEKNDSPSLRLRTNIVGAQVLSAEGQTEPASRKLRSTIKDAQKAGLFVRQLQATLALAEIEAKSGKKTEARALFQSVEKDARGKGFLLIARKAAAERG